MHAQTQALINAHLEHILTQLVSSEFVHTEAQALMTHLGQTRVDSLLPRDTLHNLLKGQILDLPVSDGLRREIISVIQTALDHPANATTTWADLVPQTSVDKLIDYLAQQKTHRESLIHQVFRNPTYAQMLSQTISHAINDYMENNVLAKKVPGVGGLMKMGKSMLEKATDSNLDQALQQYLGKNISNLIGVSERMAKTHLTDQQVKKMLQQGWESLKNRPVSTLRQHAPAQTVEESGEMAQDLWNHLRQTLLAASQLQTGVMAWHDRNATRPLADLLTDLHITPELVQRALEPVVLPLVRHAIDSGYLRQRIEHSLRQFYESAPAQVLLSQPA